MNAPLEHEWPCEHADGGAGACEDSNCPVSRPASPLVAPEEAVRLVEELDVASSLFRPAQEYETQVEYEVAKEHRDEARTALLNYIAAQQTELLRTQLELARLRVKPMVDEALKAEARTLRWEP